MTVYSVHPIHTVSFIILIYCQSVMMVVTTYLGTYFPLRTELTLSVTLNGFKRGSRGHGLAE